MLWTGERYLPRQLRSSIRLYALLSRADADFCCSTCKRIHWLIDAHSDFLLCSGMCQLKYQLHVNYRFDPVIVIVVMFTFKIQPGKPSGDCSGRCCSEDPGSHSGRRGTFCGKIVSKRNKIVKFSIQIIKWTSCGETLSSLQFPSSNIKSSSTIFSAHNVRFIYWGGQRAHLSDFFLTVSNVSSHALPRSGGGCCAGEPGNQQCFFLQHSLNFVSWVPSKYAAGR